MSVFSHLPLWDSLLSPWGSGWTAGWGSDLPARATPSHPWRDCNLQRSRGEHRQSKRPHCSQTLCLAGSWLVRDRGCWGSFSKSGVSQTTPLALWSLLKVESLLWAFLFVFWFFPLPFVPLLHLGLTEGRFQECLSVVLCQKEESGLAAVWAHSCQQCPAEASRHQVTPTQLLCLALLCLAVLCPKEGKVSPWVLAVCWVSPAGMCQRLCWWRDKQGGRLTLIFPLSH